MLVDHRLHDTARGVREPPRLILDAIVACPLAAADQRVKGGKEIERHQQGPALQELAVVDAAGRGQRVLQLPGEADARVMVRMARPARVRATGHRFPQARHALGEPVERRAKADVADEGEGGALARPATRRRAAEAPIAKALERLCPHEVSLTTFPSLL